MARVIWSPRAADDLEAICEYIARDSIHYARLVAKRIVATVEGIAEFPEAGSIVPEFDQTEIREHLVHRYRVIYRICGEAVEVVAIIHGFRRLSQLSDLDWKNVAWPRRIHRRHSLPVRFC